MHLLNRPSPRRRAGVVLAAALVLVASGCSGGGEDEAHDSSSGSSSSAVSSSASGSAPSSSDSGSPDAASASTPSSSNSGDTLGSATFTVTSSYTRQPVTMRFDLVELKRRGDLMDLTARLTNTATDRSQDLRWQVASRFTGSYREDLTNTSGAFSGTVLTDVTGKKRYFVAADSGNNCVCTDNLSSTFVGAGQTLELTATYAAPPTSTTMMDVAVPQLPVFRDVPVS